MYICRKFTHLQEKDDELFYYPFKRWQIATISYIVYVNM